MLSEYIHGVHSYDGCRPASTPDHRAGIDIAAAIFFIWIFSYCCKPQPVGKKVFTVYLES